jgi:inositol-pentakisphosphate 2-kinase
MPPFSMLSRKGKDENDDSWVPKEDVIRLQDIARYDANDPAVSDEGVKSLPGGTVPTRYIGEGAANVVFEISLPKDHPYAGYFRREHNCLVTTRDFDND